MSDPWEQLDKLQEAIQKAVEPLGVRLEHWAVMPEHRACNVVFHISPEAFKSDEDLAFEKIVEGDRVHEAHEAEQKRVADAAAGARKAAEDMLAGKSFLDDTPDE